MKERWWNEEIEVLKRERKNNRGKYKGCSLWYKDGW